MTGAVRSGLTRWGSRLQAVYTDRTEDFRAILEPVTSNALQNMRRQMAGLGQVPGGQFLYLGDRDISRAEFLRRNGLCFLPRRCEAVCLGDRVLFYWGLATPVGEESEWKR